MTHTCAALKDEVPRLIGAPEVLRHHFLDELEDSRWRERRKGGKVRKVGVDRTKTLLGPYGQGPLELTFLSSLRDGPRESARP